jgi:hypothetical protein
MNISFKSGDSCIWRVIVKVVEILRLDFICRVGRGDISVWYDKWIDYAYLCNIVPCSYVDIDDTSLRLCNFVQHS